MFGGRISLIGDPGVDVLILGIEQPFEGVERGFIEIGDVPVGETAKNQVNLAEPPAPRTESEFLAAVVHRFREGLAKGAA